MIIHLTITWRLGKDLLIRRMGITVRIEGVVRVRMSITIRLGGWLMAIMANTIKYNAIIKG